MPSIVKFLPVIYQTATVYLALILGLRFLSMRQLGQLSVIDLIIILLLGSCVETSMIHFDTSLTAGLISATTLLLLNRIFAVVLPHFGKLKDIVQGQPMLLIHNGEFIEEHLKRLGLTHADVLEALREREHADLSDVKDAIMEVDGQINVIPKDAVVMHSDRRAHRRHHGNASA